MNDSMSHRSLHDVMDRATDAIEPPGLAEGALAEARRRRTRRRGAASSLVAAAVVVVLVVSVRVVSGDPRAEETPADPASPTVAEVRTAPAIPLSRVQDVWDPRGVEALAVVDLGVPRVLPSAPTGTGPVTEAVALLDDDEQPLLVAADGTAVALDLPTELGRWRHLALSSDGRRVAAIGRALFWRDLDGGSWRRIDRPRGIEVEARVSWLGPDEILLSGYRTGIRVDVVTGEQDVVGFARSTGWWAPSPEGGFVTYDLTGVTERAGSTGDREIGRTLTGEVGSLQRFRVGEDAIASARANTTFPRETAAHEDGLIVVDRGTLWTRAFLPVPYEATWYSDGGHLSALHWLDDDTVLFTVEPKGAAKEYVVAWDLETGELSRITCWATSYAATFASDLFERR